jgi:hypothetical protein
MLWNSRTGTTVIIVLRNTCANIVSFSEGNIFVGAFESKLFEQKAGGAVSPLSGHWREGEGSRDCLGKKPFSQSGPQVKESFWRIRLLSGLKGCSLAG